MNKGLKITLIILGVLVAIMVLGNLGFRYMKKQTKKASPEQIIEYDKRGLDLEVFYCRPSKKDRDIFGEAGLVPYGEVWRTGANEPTTFETATNLKIEGQTLPAGKYSVWTIPNEQEWEVIFNTKMYPWGVSFGASAPVEREFDALIVKAPVEILSEPVEMFTIGFEEGEATRLIMMWDDTKISMRVNE